jgi:thymidylate synthase
MARNLTEALTNSLAKLLSEGATVPSRNGETKEIYAHQVLIENPKERVVMTPARGANLFAQLAESMWVLGGRDDMKFLSRYLPRAPDYSDDGVVWRGAYGPRMRAWPMDSSPEGIAVRKTVEALGAPPEFLHGDTRYSSYSLTNPRAGTHVDQLEECVKLLCEDPETRRAVMIIFDPARDYCQSKDIPCNNWLHFLIRGGKLNLTVGVRSNDAIWGFSGINMFEWSVLQEMVAHWVGAEVGTMAYTASSFHLYDRHYEKAEKIVSRAKPKTMYDFGIKQIPFQTGWEDFGSAMDEFFSIEEKFEGDPTELLAEEISAVEDPFLRTTLQMLQIYRQYQKGTHALDLARMVAELPSCDLRVGACDFLNRQKRVREEDFLDLLDQVGVLEDGTNERAYFEWYRKPPTTNVSVEEIFEVLKVLHEKKTRSYGDSWKKHGEVLGLFSNITRKWDRIEALEQGALGTADEGLFDTVSDLCVYAGKYLTLLAEMYPVPFSDYLQTPNRQIVYPVEVDAYAHTMGFDSVLDLLSERLRVLDPRLGALDGKEPVLGIQEEYEILEDLLTDKHRPRAGNRPQHGHIAISAAARMCLLCAKALQDLCRENPGTWESYTNIVENL